MGDPITLGIAATVLGMAVSVTEIGENIISWFYEPEPMCNTKVHDDPEQWGMRPCLDVIEGERR